MITEEERINDIAFAYCRRVLTDVESMKAVSYNGTSGLRVITEEGRMKNIATAYCLMTTAYWLLLTA